MKITTKGRNAIHILYDLAVNTSENPISVKEIATRQGISVKYTEQIMSVLHKGGYVNSSRGFQGGYRLTRKPEEYIIGDILRLTEGDLAPVDCLNQKEHPCPKHAHCETIPLWEKINEAVVGVVDSVTIADLMKWQNLSD